MKLTYNGKEYEVTVAVKTDAHEGITMELSKKVAEDKTRTYSGPFDIERFHSFLEECFVMEKLHSLSKDVTITE